MSTDRLTFSIVVNTIDRAIPLRTLLRSLEHQSYPYFEVIVVVGPTRDNTLEILREYDQRIRILHCPTANLSRSRNIGLLDARGDIVVFIDDDAVPCYGWLDQLARLFKAQLLAGTGGKVYTIHPLHSTVQHCLGLSSSLAEQNDVLSSWIDKLTNSGRACHWIERMMGTNMAFRRQSLLQVGGFDEFYGYIAEETDLIFRLVNAGMEVYPVKEAVVYHIPTTSRNRSVFTHQGKWWLRSRSRVYFAIKNGWASGETIRSIAWQSLRIVGAHWLWYARLLYAKQLSPTEILKLFVKEVPAWVDAVWHGVLGARQLLPPNAIKLALENPQPIRQYQQIHSPEQAVVDPVNGYSPNVTLVEPPLRICLLSGSYPPKEYDGIGRHTNLLARGLFELGHTVHVIARGEREQVSFYDGAYVHRIVPRLDRYHQYRVYLNLFHNLNYSHAVYDQVRRNLLNDGVQIVDSPLWQFEGLVTAVKAEVPVVVRVQTSMSQVMGIHRTNNPDLQLICELERALAKKCMHLIPNSLATLRAAQEYLGFELPDDKCTMIPYGTVPIPAEQTQPFDPDRMPETFTVLYVGRLEKRKGILNLFEAIPRVLALVPNVRFVIVGADNSRHDGFQVRSGTTYLEYFTRHYSRYSSQVQFTGAVSDDTLQQMYRSCDLFVAPSLYESFGLIYLEAMNYAKPVVACRVGGIPEVVEDGVTGVLVEPGNSSAIAQAIITLLQSPVRLRDSGLAGRERLLRYFTHIQMAKASEGVYRRAIAAFKENNYATYTKSRANH